MLNFSKRASIVELVHQSQNDSKKLFSLVNNIIGRKTSNPLLKSRTSGQLNEDFVSYFLDKIDKIRERFKEIEPYQPSEVDVPQIAKFALVSSSRLGQIIRKMQSKTCQLDEIPTAKLQEILEGCLPSITHIVNSSLDQGKFCKDWKEAIVKPLIKKKELETQNSNYRPELDTIAIMEKSRPNNRQ